MDPNLYWFCFTDVNLYTDPVLIDLWAAEFSVLYCACVPRILVLRSVAFCSNIDALGSTRSSGCVHNKLEVIVVASCDQVSN